MNTKERIATLILLEKINKNPKYAEKLGLKVKDEYKNKTKYLHKNK